MHRSPPLSRRPVLVSRAVLVGSFLGALAAGCRPEDPKGGPDTGELEEEAEAPRETREPEPEPEESASGPDVLPFQECEDAPKFNTIDVDDFDIQRDRATLSGTYYRCGTWGFEESTEQCYESSQDLSNGISNSLTEALVEYFGGLVNVDCDSDVEVTCGPLYPDVVYEMFDDGEFRCCFLIDLDVECRY